MRRRARRRLGDIPRREPQQARRWRKVGERRVGWSASGGVVRCHGKRFSRPKKLLMLLALKAEVARRGVLQAVSLSTASRLQASLLALEFPSSARPEGAGSA